MNLIGNICSSLFPDLSGDSKNREAVRGIDASIRFPLLALIKSGFVWLIVATVFGLIGSIKLHSPGFLADWSVLTYGKVAPIFWNTLVYGWLFNAGLACAVFLLSRLGGNHAGLGVFLTISVTLWNTGVMAGIIGIMWGEQLPFEWLEFPAFAAGIVHRIPRNWNLEFVDLQGAYSSIELRFAMVDSRFNLFVFMDLHRCTGDAGLHASPGPFKHW